MAPEEALCQHFQRAADLIGRRWNPMILRALQSGVSRYSDLKAGIPQISDTVLSERLKELEAAGLLEREVTRAAPVRVDYRLTERGRDLCSVMTELAGWAERWADEPVATGAQ
jgi:DNA-binding HxlR family transcriptional regulator